MLSEKKMQAIINNKKKREKLFAFHMATEGVGCTVIMF
jgi:hypothetical protein